MAATEVKVPDIGDFKDIPVIELLVKPGDTVQKDDSLLVLESDKATMEVPAPAAGVIAELKVKIGDKVSAGTLVALLEGSNGAAPAVTNGNGKAKAGDSARRAGGRRACGATRAGARRRRAVGARACAGRRRRAGGVAWRHRPREPRRAPVRARAGRAARSGDRVRPEEPDPQGGHPVLRQAVARRRRERARRRRLADLGLPPWPKVDFAKFGPIETQPRTRIQKISAPGLARNWVMIPHVTQFDEADITELEAFRAHVNEENAKAGVKVSPLAFLMKAVVAALKKYPTVNSSLDGENLIVKQYWNIGFAADTPQGLVVPVIKDVDKKGILDIAKETTELAAKARDGKLGPNDIQGATFTISSLGGIGGTAFTPIINAPEVAILGVSRSAVKPVWNGKEFAPRTMLPLSLSYDHRVVDGALAARFTTYLGQVIADIRRVML